MAWAPPMLFKLLVAGAVCYVSVLALLYVFQRSLIYYPNDYNPHLAAYNLPSMREVRVPTADGLSLRAWWAPPADARAPVVLYLHGNAGGLGARAEKVRPFLERGFGVLLLAWRGFSGNAGSPDEAGLYEDGRAALRFLDGQGIAPARRAIYGESLGSAVAVQLAVEGAPGAIVLESAFSSMADAAGAHYPIFPVAWLLKDRYESAAKIGAVRAPVLVLHGERDRVVPVRLGRALFAAAREPKQARFYPAAGHDDLHNFGAGDLAADFIARHIPKKTNQ